MPECLEPLPLEELELLLPEWPSSPPSPPVVPEGPSSPPVVPEGPPAVREGSSFPPPPAEGDEPPFLPPPPQRDPKVGSEKHPALPSVDQGTCKPSVALLINGTSSADRDSLTTGAVLSDSTSSDGNASSCLLTSSEAASESTSSCCQSALGAAALTTRVQTQASGFTQGTRPQRDATNRLQYTNTCI
ncbi:UNVERIFIED_CONTAM: hypothetical protein FKN15_018889 [Acipenser sinensis]